MIRQLASVILFIVLVVAPLTESGRRDYERAYAWASRALHTYIGR